MKKETTLKDWGLKLTVNKELDKYHNLFPEKLELANSILTNMKFTHIKLK